ncbi:MAG: LPS-assembly protein [Paracoccaceae bacterium]|jgi:LPS-assembly protein
MKRLTVLLLLIASFAWPTYGQNASQFASLKADRIVYVSGYQVLRASGHVEIVFGTIKLTATELVFDANNNRIEAKGPLRIQDGDDITIVADYASLSSDLRNGILKGARMVLNQQLQIAAVEISRRDGQFTELFKAAASSCKVSVAHPTPFWQVRAKRIVHDDVAKQLYFEAAQVRILSVPVAYIPRLRVPDPSVKRANGFLVPGIKYSAARGVGVSVPYFITLGDYADVTVSPELYSSGTATLGYDYRKRFARGKLDITGSANRDAQTNDALRAHLFATGDWKSKSGFRTEIQLELVSDATYLDDFGISSNTRLENFARINKTTSHSYFGAGVSGYRTLSSTTPADEIPYLLGNVSLQKRFSPNLLGGQANISLAANSFDRLSTTDITGRDGVRISSSVDWHHEWIANSGLVFAADTQLHADYYDIRQDSTYATPVSRITPIAAIDFRLPLVRTTAKATNVIEPRAQLVWANPSGGAVPDDDSTQVEFDAQSLFSLNRFSGTDRVETGLRANVGLTYSRRANSGARFDGALGRVFRISDLSQFTSASGLSGTASSFVMSGQVILPSKLRLVQRTVWDDGTGVSRNETAFGYKNKFFDIDTSYLWLLQGAAGNTVNRSEWLVDTGINFANNWRTEASYRYDLETAATSDAGLSLTYRNDCIKVDFSLSRSFVSSSNVTASTDFGLQVTLEGFGARIAGNTSGHDCAEY